MPVAEKATVAAQKDRLPIPYRSQPSNPRRFHVWGAIVISLGLHAIVLFLPLPSQTPPPAPQAKTIRVTNLKQLRLAGRSQPKISMTPKQRSIAPRLNPLARRSVPAASPFNPAPASKPSPDSPRANSAKSTTAASWDDFPHYPAAQAGCFDLGEACHKTEASLTQVSAFFEQKLPDRQYTASLFTSEPTRLVYRVSKAGFTQFLSLLTVEGRTAYVLAEEPRSLNDLNKAVEVPLTFTLFWTR